MFVYLRVSQLSLNLCILNFEFTSVDNRWKLIGNMDELSTNKDEDHWLIIERTLLDDLTPPIKLTKSVQVC